MEPRSTAAPVIHRTAFLVPNIHCPTCTDFVENLLLSHDPAPKSVTTSIITHTITVEHNDSVDPVSISKALAGAGYRVDSVVTDDGTRDIEAAILTGPTDDDFPLSWVNHLTQTLSRGSQTANEEEEQRRHREHCTLCREAHPEEDTLISSRPTSASKPGDALSAVVVNTPPSDKVYQAKLSVGGMSCSSCVGKITSALEEKAWVQSANVGLLTRTATVNFFDVGRTKKLVDIISALGYDTVLGEVEELPATAKAIQPTDDLWRATVSISGMSCSSCVGKITAAVKKLPWMRSIDVNLVTSSATAVFEDRSHLADIISTIRELGYQASLSDLTEERNGRTKDTERTLFVRVEGMYCQHCPDRVLAAINSFGGRVRVGKPLSQDKPLLSISYVPEPPSLTVRAILKSISDVDAAFTPTIYHPPTVEERSKQMLDRSRRRTFLRLLLTFIAAVPALIIGIVYMNLAPSGDPNKEYLMEQLAGVSRADWSLLVMATPVYFFATDVFHRRTIKELYSLWRPGSTVPLLRRFYRFGSMDMLVSFATTIAYFSSIAEIIIAATAPNGHHGKMPAHMDAVIFLTFFLLTGRMIEAYSKAKTGEAVTKLGSLRPNEALLLEADKKDDGAVTSQKISIDMLETGDLVRVVHGASPPWDGVLREGEAEFIESSLTGESKPVKKRLGDPIYSGTINKGGPITIRLTGASGDSLLDSIIKVVREGQARRAPIERVADAITGYFVPIVTLIAIVTWLTWLGLGMSGRLPESWKDVAIGGWPFWSLQFAIAVFVIACPCGIGLAAPTALFVGGGLAAKYGILAKGGGEAFQEASKLDIIVFDKTGTLTEGGEPKLTDHLFLQPPIAQDWTDKTILSCLGELEGSSSHPIAKAIVTFCASRTSASNKPEQVQEIPGKGIKGSFTIPSSSSLSPRRVEMIVGNEALMNDHTVHFDRAILDTLDCWKDQAKSIVLLAARSATPDGEGSWMPLAAFAVSDALRPEARPVLEALRAEGIEVWMISGDNVKTAEAVGAMVGISADRIIAGVLPEQKAEKIRYLQKSQIRVESWCKRGEPKTRRPTVAMIGDGVNDSPALTVADVGIAIGSGSDVAISAAEFVLVNASLTTLLTLIRLSRAVFRRVKFNFAWALVYNVVALPIAAGVLYPIKTNGSHTRLDAVWAALAMALSSLSVISSSLLLRTRLPLIGYRHKEMKDLA